MPPLSDIDTDAIWQKHFREAIANEFQHSGISPSEWTAYGKTRDNPTGQDGTYWSSLGPTLVREYAEWRRETKWDLWVAPDGQLGNELELNVLLDGTKLKIIIDRVMWEPTDRQVVGTDNAETTYDLVIVDAKTSKANPDSDLQLGLGAVALEVAYGVRPTKGVYWMARKQALYYPRLDLSRYTVHMVSQMLGQFDRARKDGIYIPNPGSNCFTCSVGQFCAINGGLKASQHDSLHVDYGKAPQ